MLNKAGAHSPLITKSRRWTPPILARHIVSSFLSFNAISQQLRLGPGMTAWLACNPPWVSLGAFSLTTATADRGSFRTQLGHSKTTTAFTVGLMHTSSLIRHAGLANGILLVTHWLSGQKIRLPVDKSFPRDTVNA